MDMNEAGGGVPAQIPVRHEPMLAWVVVAGVLRRVTEFAGLLPRERPEAKCPVCERAVDMKLGKVRAHHVAHRKGDECASTAPETALHLNAKFHLAEQLAKVGSVRLLEPCAKGSQAFIPCIATRNRPWSVTWDQVEVERRVGARRPDITLSKAGGPVGAVEVFATHAVDERKARDLEALGLPWLEVRAAAVFSEQLWQATAPLPLHRLQPAPAWLCRQCRPHDPVIELPPARSALDDLPVRCARVVDFYYPSMRWFRDVFEVLEEWGEGGVVALVLRAWSGLTKRFPGAGEEAMKAIDAYFEQRQAQLRERDSILDLASPWLDNCHEQFARYSSARAEACYRDFPRRYRKNEVLRQWEHGNCWIGGAPAR